MERDGCIIVMVIIVIKRVFLF